MITTSINPLATITGDRTMWCGIPEQAMSYVIAEAVQKHSGTTVLFATDANQAQRWFEELNFFLGKQSVPIALFPDWETLPYDAFSPHQDIISDRLRLLSKLPSWSQGIVIVPVITALHRLAPTNYIQQHSLVLKNKDSLELTSMREQLERSGYQCVSTVQEHGEFAVRGSILDIFPMGSKMPFRIELFDDEVESIRTFDPDNQRSVATLESIEVLPAKEFPLHKNGISTFKNRWHTFFTSHRDVSIYDDVSKGISAPGIEYYLPLFFEQTATLFDYLPKNTLMIYPRNLPEVVEHLWKDIQNRYTEYNIDHRRPLLPPNEIFLRNEQFFEKVGAGKRLLVTAELLEEKAGVHAWNFQLPPALHADHRETEPLKKLIAFAKSNVQLQCILCVESPGRRETLIDLLRNSGLSLQPVNSWLQARQAAQKMDLHICVGPLDRGFILSDQSLIVLTEQDIFGQRVAQSRRRQRDAQSRLILENAIK
ncbi:MAG: transcription-repair coupling factor, partial [Pseudomonadota bacterium]